MRLMAPDRQMTRHGTGMAVLGRCYDRLLALCDRLEAIADSLPGSVDPATCTALAIDLADALPQAHAEEERVLLPLLAISERPELRHLANRLRQEHRLDAAAAMEIEETLLALATGRPLLSAEATGYQLRSFFESVRRHVRAEQDMLVLLGDMSRNGDPAP